MGSQCDMCLKQEILVIVQKCHDFCPLTSGLKCKRTIFTIVLCGYEKKNNNPKLEAALILIFRRKVFPLT